MYVQYKVLLSYGGTEVLAYPTGTISFWVFMLFVGVAFIANFVAWAYSAESFLGSIGWILGFALFTTLFTGASAVGCRSDGCGLAEVMAMAMPWGWLFGALALVGAIVIGIMRLYEWLTR